MAEIFLVTGGAGFIGSALVRYLIKETNHRVINVDKLTYAGNLESVASIESSDRYHFVQLDISDASAVEDVFNTYKPTRVMHLAAETHVDRSIDDPSNFIKSNILGSYTLLDISRRYWKNLSEEPAETFRFLHVSTDEVYGTLGQEGLFSETTAYDPRSPYSASKAASDHLAKAWFHTYKLPIVITNCSNNYGPYQFPEKLIPVVILKALAGEAIPVYGTGASVRDWLFVDDHVRGLLRAVEKGALGETYNIGGHNEVKTLDVVKLICEILNEIHPGNKDYKDLISFVEDRPGHDMRYAIDAGKIKADLAWTPAETFASGLRKTVSWYVENQDWCERVLDGSYALERLGKSQ